MVSDAWRSDSRELELAADSSIDADTDALYMGASARSISAEPWVTLVQPTMIIAPAARLPRTSATIRSRVAAQPTGQHGLQTLPVWTGDRGFIPLRTPSGASGAR